MRKTFPLHVAASHGHVVLLRNLIADCQYDLDGPDQSGNRALHCAAWCGYTEALDCLVLAGASLDIVNNDGFAPIHLAAWIGYPVCVERLVNHGADINISELKHGWTPLHRAVLGAQPDCIRSLLELGADWSLRDKAGSTAFELAEKLYKLSDPCRKTIRAFQRSMRSS